MHHALLQHIDSQTARERGAQLRRAQGLHARGHRRAVRLVRLVAVLKRKRMAASTHDKTTDQTPRTKNMETGITTPPLQSPRSYFFVCCCRVVVCCLLLVVVSTLV